MERDEQRSLFSDNVGDGIANSLYLPKLFDLDGWKLASSFFFVAFLWNSTSSRSIRKRMLRTQPRLIINTYNRYVAIITVFEYLQVYI